MRLHDTRPFLAAFLMLLVFACSKSSNDGSSNANDQVTVDSVLNEDELFATQANMPACDTAHDKRLAYVKDSATLFVCNSGSWSAVEIPGLKDLQSEIDTFTSALAKKIDKYDSASKFPTCNASLNKQLAYAADLKQLSYCDGSNWIALTGTKGDKGDTGAPGTNGTNGANGEQGPRGPAGSGAGGSITYNLKYGFGFTADSPLAIYSSTPNGGGSYDFEGSTSYSSTNMTSKTVAIDLGPEQLQMINAKPTDNTNTDVSVNVACDQNSTGDNEYTCVFSPQDYGSLCVFANSSYSSYVNGDVGYVNGSIVVCPDVNLDFRANQTDNHQWNELVMPMWGDVLAGAITKAVTDITSAYQAPDQSVIDNANNEKASVLVLQSQRDQALQARADAFQARKTAYANLDLVQASYFQAQYVCNSGIQTGCDRKMALQSSLDDAQNAANDAETAFQDAASAYDSAKNDLQSAAYSAIQAIIDIFPYNPDPNI